MERREEDKPSDAINPKHYKDHPSGVECITIIEHFGFNLGSAVKYIWRCGLKKSADPVEDLKKALWYLNREIENRTGKRAGVEVLVNTLVDTSAKCKVCKMARFGYAVGSYDSFCLCGDRCKCAKPEMPAEDSARICRFCQKPF